MHVGLCWLQGEQLKVTVSGLVVWIVFPKSSIENLRHSSDGHYAASNGNKTVRIGTRQYALEQHRHRQTPSSFFFPPDYVESLYGMSRPLLSIPRQHMFLDAPPALSSVSENCARFR